MELIRKILKAGISIVTVSNGQELTPENCNDTGRLMMVVMSLCLAHEESDKKAKRMRQAWSAKRAMASEKPMTAKVPAWIQVDGGAFKLIPKAANTVRLIFGLALDPPFRTSPWRFL